jgi:uncharacterized glyoxalase superfamily protein PhnB
MPTIQDLYPIIVTDQFRACRDFYVKHFGFQVIFEASWIAFVALNEDGSRGIAFMSSDHPSTPPGPELFSGEGMFLTLQVEDAAAEEQRLKQEGAKLVYPLTDEAWGQRRFAMRDPAGTWVDVVQQIEPAKGFWERYAV